MCIPIGYYIIYIINIIIKYYQVYNSFDISNTIHKSITYNNVFILFTTNII